MYRSEKFNPTLFGKLFHLGARLDDENRWLKLSAVIPWEKLDAEYGQYFTQGSGRPAKDSRLVKNLKNISDEDAVAEFMESPYLQAFCGQEYFALENVLSPGMLSERRKRLGAAFLDLLEAELAAALKTVKDLKFRSARQNPAEPCFLCALLEKARGAFAKK
jgi:IS5 family transposase